VPLQESTVFWPIKCVRYSEGHVGDPSLESQVFSAITGREIDEEGLYELEKRGMTESGSQFGHSWDFTDFFFRQFHSR
jgi:hypothetical protein